MKIAIIPTTGGGDPTRGLEIATELGVDGVHIGAYGGPWDLEHKTSGERAEILKQIHSFDLEVSALIGWGGNVDLGEEDNLAYLVMELVRGVPATDFAIAGKLGIEARLRLFLEIAEAVQFAHQNLVVHRDLKPGNVMLVPDNSVADGERVKLLDFGIAKLSLPVGSGAAPIKSRDCWASRFLPIRSSYSPFSSEVALSLTPPPWSEWNASRSSEVTDRFGTSNWRT